MLPLLVFIAQFFMGLNGDFKSFPIKQLEKVIVDESHLPESNVNHRLEKPLHVGVIGLTHAHVHWILGRDKIGDIEIVGIVEPNRALAQRFSKQHGFSMDIVFESMQAMITVVQPQAVTAFNDIYGHLEVVQFCAPRGIHVMVEKPLAVSLAHAKEMESLAQQHQIQLLTNYETTWYPTHWEAYHLIHEADTIGDIRKMVFYTGHPGPVEIGCNQEFLDWLTDPILNGGGALTDFGCYGANLATWFMKGEEPVSVTCMTQQIKPHLYPKVDDEATILLEYPKAQVIIQASWNWSHNRKETEIYGQNGFVKCKNGTEMEFMPSEKLGVQDWNPHTLPKGANDPFAYLAKVVRSGYQGTPYNPNTLANNMIVTRILEGARISASKGQTIAWEEIAD